MEQPQNQERRSAEGGLKDVGHEEIGQKGEQDSHLNGSE